MPATFGVVFITTRSETEAQALARSLVTAQLAACVNYFPVRSVYSWVGELHDEPEWQLVIKTRLAVVPTLVEHVQARHAYDLPEIIALPIDQGSPAYLQWLDHQVQSGPSTAAAIAANEPPPKSWSPDSATDD